MVDAYKSDLKLLLPTLITSILLGTLLSMEMMATGLVFVVIFLVFWLPYSLVVIVRNPDKRKSQALKIGIWFIMVTVVLGIHVNRREYTREHAEIIAQKIEEFHKTKARYPNSLEEIGISQDELNGRLALLHYLSNPMLYYADTMVIFHVWSYNFEKHEWISEYD